MTITARAFAKINLDLRIVGVQPDGYHELRTTFQSIALHDRLLFKRTRGPFLVESDEPACPTAGNIVEKAASLLWSAVGRQGAPTGVAVRIEKRIPLEAGLGGGSADAAAALRALSSLWRLRPDRAVVHQIAASLGADVPFFLIGGTARGGGRGDRLTPLDDAPRRWVVLAVPRFGVSTRDAYGWFDAATFGGSAGAAAGRRRLGSRGGNDLQRVVSLRHPEIADLVAGLRRCGASHAAMSGSGSAVFGLFATLPAAEAAAAALLDSGRRLIVTRTLSAPNYRRLSRPVLARK